MAATAGLAAAPGPAADDGVCAHVSLAQPDIATIRETKAGPSNRRARNSELNITLAGNRCFSQTLGARAATLARLTDPENYYGSRGRDGGPSAGLTALYSAYRTGLLNRMLTIKLFDNSRESRSAEGRDAQGAT